MAARKKDDVSRWLMKNRVQKTSDEDINSSSGTSKLAKLAEKVLNDEQEQRKRQAQVIRSRIEESLKGEDLDFDELFDDDEGNDNFGGLLDDITAEEAAATGASNSNGQNQNNPHQSSMKSNYKLSSEGRVMKKIVRHLDKSNDIIYASDDENDPYASDFENEEEDDDFDKWTNNNQNASTAAAGQKPKLPQSATSTTSKTTSNPSSKTSSLTSSRAASPIGSPNKANPSVNNANAKSAATSAKTNKRSKTSDDEDSLVVITESEIIGYLKQGPISTKDLISKFKRQLKADPKNKEIFRELVRKLAMVKAVAGSGEEDKLLELKPEFK